MDEYNVLLLHKRSKNKGPNQKKKKKKKKKKKREKATKVKSLVLRRGSIHNWCVLRLGTSVVFHVDVIRASLEKIACGSSKVKLDCAKINFREVLNKIGRAHVWTPVTTCKDELDYMKYMYSRHGRAKAGVKNSLATFVHAKKMKSLVHAKKIKLHSKGGHPTSKNPCLVQKTEMIV